jgi:hypothetical protein
VNKVRFYSGPPPPTKLYSVVRKTVGRNQLIDSGMPPFDYLLT